VPRLYGSSLRDRRPAGAACRCVLGRRPSRAALACPPPSSAKPPRTAGRTRATPPASPVVCPSTAALLGGATLAGGLIRLLQSRLSSSFFNRRGTPLGAPPKGASVLCAHQWGALRAERQRGQAPPPFGSVGCAFRAPHLRVMVHGRSFTITAYYRGVLSRSERVARLAPRRPLSVSTIEKRSACAGSSLRLTGEAA
jgi:hypothetical protein